jgi:integrase
VATTKRRNRGYIEQRSSGSYRAVVYAGVDPLTGRERYLRESAPTRKAAQAALSRLQTQVDERRHPRSGVTVGELLEQWTEVARHETSTAERYADLIRVYLLPTFGSMRAGKLDAELLERFYGRLLRCRKLCSGTKRRGHTCEPLAPNTVRKIHFVMRSALALGVRWRHLGVNEAAIAQPPAFEPHDPDPPSPAEAAALLNEVADDPEWCLFLWLTMTTGSRRGEMCALRWSDLDLTRRTVSVAHNTDGKTVKSTKTHQGRRIALDDVAVEMLTAFKDQRIELCTKLGADLDDEAFVFGTNPDGSVPLRPRTASQRFRRLAERLKLRSKRLHSLRHYSATELIAAGVDIRTVAGRLGHGSGGATTLKVYAAWVADADRRAADAIGRILPRPEASQRRPRAPYEMVAAGLRERIETGEFPPGAELPPVPDIAAAHSVSVGTAQRAISLLRSEALVTTGPGRRTTVA